MFSKYDFTKILFTVLTFPVLFQADLLSWCLGFEDDSYFGVDLRQIDLDKFVLFGNSLDPNNEKGIVLELYKIIKEFSGYENDGVVVFDKEHFDRRGINYVLDEHTNHFNSLNPEKLERVYQLSKKM